MRYYSLILGLVVCAAVGLLMFAAHREFRTDYSSGTLKQQWQLVAAGDSIQSLYAKVGAPLFVAVNSDRAGSGAYCQTRDGDTEPLHLERFSPDTNVALYLHYSWPAEGASGYYRYEADVVGGVVVQKTEGELVD